MNEKITLKQIILGLLVVSYFIAGSAHVWLETYLVDDFNLWIASVLTIPICMLVYKYVKYSDFKRIDPRYALLYFAFPLLFWGLNLSIVNNFVPWCYTAIAGESFTLQAEIVQPQEVCDEQCSYYLVVAASRKNDQGESSAVRYQFFNNRKLNNSGLSVSEGFYRQVKKGDKIIIKGLKSNISWNIKSYEIYTGE